MPELCLNMGALEHNFYLVSAKTREWDFSWLPVLKMTADFPPVKAFLHDHGLPATGTADIEDIWTGGAGGSDVPDEEREGLPHKPWLWFGEA
ncbi:MAG: hypothetical protein Q4F72_05640 [Desulfovibrionaceae bacterium]|nr:hypothetical protein [Desulfovibrionaceae bacterium]